MVAKKLIKKLKKSLVKRIANFKSYLKDQLFYTISLIKNLASAAKDIAILTAKLTSLGIFIVLVSLSVNKVHTKYIESHVGDNTVFIKSPKDAKKQGSATAFEVRTPSGKVYTLTNAHVCELANDAGFVMIQEKLHSDRFIPRRVIEIYEDNDLCLVEGLDGYSGLSVANDLEIGDPVWSVGYPLGQSMNISSGRIKSFEDVEIPEGSADGDNCKGPHQKVMGLQTMFGALQFCVTIRPAAETDVATFPGNSGSPMVNIYGNVVGVMFASNRSTSWGSAVPLSDVVEFLKAY